MIGKELARINKDVRKLKLVIRLGCEVVKHFFEKERFYLTTIKFGSEAIFLLLILLLKQKLNSKI